MLAATQSWQSLVAAASGTSLVSEAVSLLNGAHVGLNSRLGALLRQTRRQSTAAIATHHREEPVTTSAQQHSVYNLVMEELGVTPQLLSKVHQAWPLQTPPTVSSLLHAHKGLVVGQYAFQTRRRYSTLCRSLSSSLYSDLRTIPIRQVATPRFLSKHSVEYLETRANSETDDPRVQAAYLKAVLDIDPGYVVRRYRSGRYANDLEVHQVYEKALERVRNQESSSLFNYSPPSLGSKNGAVGTKDNPVYVVAHSRKGVIRELWSLARSVIVALVITTFIASALFSQLKTGSQQISKDFRPDMGQKRYTFEDVQGIDEAKAEVREVVEFLKNPSRFKKLGAKLPTGVLLVGAPGTGKTLLAKAIAGEAEVPFFFATGSEFDEMFVGVGAARVRRLFDQARKHRPCVVFIDELDAVGGARVASAVHPYSRMTLNQLLVELDGYKELDGVIVIGATNFPEALDKALIRPGRFDTHIDIPMPDIRARHNILKVHAAKVKLSEDVDLRRVARATVGFSGADLANLVNQAAIKGSANNSSSVTLGDLEYAKDRILMGPERKSAVIREEEKEITAYHEGGHAIVALYTPGAHPIHKATIIPRGKALGMVMQLPEKDVLMETKKQLMAKLDVFMAGRVAEELMFGSDNITTGAANDLKVATQIAKAMVTKFAMSDLVGPMAHSDKEHPSPATKKLIEDEVKRILKDAHDRACSVLKTHAVEHKRLAEALLKYETLDLEEIKLVVAAKPLKRDL